MMNAKMPAPSGSRHLRDNRSRPNPTAPAAHRRVDGYAAPSAEDRAVAAALAVIAAAGFGIAARCLDCGRPITAAASLARMRGPSCAARAAAKEAGR